MTHRLPHFLLRIELLVRLGAVEALHAEPLANSGASWRLNQLNLQQGGQEL